MNRKNSRHMIDILFTLALFGVFAICALMVVMMGAEVYRKGVQDMQNNFDTRTSLSYIATKLRRGDTQGAIATEKIGDESALVIVESIGGTEYATWIYCYEGSLREVYTLKELTPLPSDGQTIMNIEAIEITDALNGAIMITAHLPSGEVESMLYSPRC